MNILIAFLASSLLTFTGWVGFDILHQPTQEPQVAALSVLKGSQGGTGIGTGVAGDVGKVLSVSSVNPLTYTFATDQTGGGSGFPFSADTNYGQVVYSTSTPTLWLKSGIFASSTSHFVNYDATNGTTTNSTSTNLKVSGQLNWGSGTGLTLTTSGVFSNYAGTSCTNQFVRSLSASGAATCASVALASDVSGDLPFANLTQVSANSLLGNPTSATADAQSVATSTLYGVSTPGFVLMWDGTKWAPSATATCVAITGSAALCDGNDATGSGLSAYDAWTHPQTTVSATTSGIIVNSASSTIRAFDAILGTTTYATSTTFFTTNASTTNFFGAGLSTCQSGNVLTYNGSGKFGCAADATGGGGGSFPFSADSNFGQVVYSTSTPTLWFKSGFFASSTSQLGTTTIARGALLLGEATTSKQVGGGSESIGIQKTNANDTFIFSGVTNDINARWLVQVNGLMGWGAGGASDQDIQFYRNGAGNLTIQGTANSTETFRVNNSTGTAVLTVNTTSAYISVPWLLVNGAGGGAKLDVYGGGTTALRAEQTAASDVAFSAFVTGDAQLRFTFLADGTLKWGNGTSVADTTLYRYGVNILKTDGGFMAAASSTIYALSTMFATSTSTFTIPVGVSPVIQGAGSIALDTSANEFLFATSTAADPAVVKPYKTFAFSYASSTQGSGTTTRSLGPVDAAGYFDSVQCDFSNFMRIMMYDGTNRMNDLVASSTIGTVKLTTNNSFTAGEALRVDIGTTTNIAANVYGGCRAKFIYTRN